MLGKVKKVEILKKWSSKWGWNILRNVLFFRIFKLHRELENFLGMIYLSCKVIFCPPETHKHARKKKRIIGHILFSKTLKWEGGKTMGFSPPWYYLDVIILCYFSASSVRSLTICASLRSVHNNYDLFQHFHDETHYSFVTFHTNRGSRKIVLKLKEILNIFTSSFLYFFLTSFVKEIRFQFNKI